jgi:hypothetical protein
LMELKDKVAIQPEGLLRRRRLSATHEGISRISGDNLAIPYRLGQVRIACPRACNAIIPEIRENFHYEGSQTHLGSDGQGSLEVQELFGLRVLRLAIRVSLFFRFGASDGVVGVLQDFKEGHVGNLADPALHHRGDRVRHFGKTVSWNLFAQEI